MLDSTKFSTDSTLVRKKYISVSKKARIQLGKSHADSETPLNDEKCSLDINCTSSESLESSGFTSFKKSLEGISGIFNLANQSTQDSLVASQSIEDYEIKEKSGRVSLDGITKRSILSRIEIKSPSNDQILDLPNTDEFIPSNESSPHLYTTYAGKLKNILLDYFD